MTHVQAVAVVALYMQRQFMQGVPYGTAGVPNMQSIVELCEMLPGDATIAVQSEPMFAGVIAELRQRGVIL